MIERGRESGKGMPVASGVCAREGMVESGEGAGDAGCGGGWDELTGEAGEKDERTSRRGERRRSWTGEPSAARDGPGRGEGVVDETAAERGRVKNNRG